MLDHNPVMSLGSDRLRLQPWGLAGGGPGGTVGSYLEAPDGSREKLPSKTTREVAAGTRIVLRTAGGGGFGEPSKRRVESVENDVTQGFLSRDRAQKSYLVRIDPDTGKIDRKATEAARTKGGG